MKRIISAILASVMLSGTAAGAIEIQKDWVNVSAWAYNDVSNFTNEGLIPDSFEGINDYRTDITREQFAELIYSVFYEKNEPSSSEMYNQPRYRIFADTNNPVINYLYYRNIVKGTVKSENRYDIAGYNGYFMPDAPITRADAAVMLSRTYIHCPFPEYQIEKFRDDSEIPNYASTAVYSLSNADIMLGSEDGRFLPLENMSIEQAIVTLMRVYVSMPEYSDVDGAGIEAVTETLIKAYDNGFTETKLGDKLYIKSGENTVMEFETDIYSFILCCENHGKNYILARNFKKRTEVYDVRTKKLLFTVPYPVKKAVNGYIYTVSSVTDAWFYGLYDFDGNELLPPEYSEYEVDRLIERNFEPFEESAEDLYYSVNNSENPQTNGVYSFIGGKTKKLCSDNANDVFLSGGRLYYASYDYMSSSSSLYSINTDGSDKIKITAACGGVFHNSSPVYMSDSGKECVYFTEYDFSNPYDENGNFFYTINGQRERGGVTYLYRAYFENGELVKEKVLDIPTYYINFCEYDNCIYFTEYAGEWPAENTETKLYRFDGKEAALICDDAFGSFSFLGDGVLIHRADNKDLILKYGEASPAEINTPQQILPDGSEFTSENDSIFNYNIYQLELKISDDKFRIYSNLTQTFVADSNGNMTELDNRISSLYRYDDILYYNSYNSFFRYDLNSREKKLIARNVAYNFREDKENGKIIYNDSFGNLYLYSVADDTTTHIYPNHTSQETSEYNKIKNKIILNELFNDFEISGYCFADGSSYRELLP